MMLKSSAYLILFFIAIIGCQKNKPAEGSHIATFFFEDGDVRSSQIEIDKVRKDYFYVSGNKVNKDGNKVHGILQFPGLSGMYVINGKCKKGFGPGYPIKGSFEHSQTYLNGTTTYQNGDFVIK